MKTYCVDANRIQKVWDWCTDSYLRHGVRLSLPRNTRPEKTYQWRYCKTIAEKFAHWGLDDTDCQHFIDIAVRYAKKAGILRKGLAILHQGNVLDVVYGMMREEKSSQSGTLDVLIHTKRWLESQIQDKPPLEVLLQNRSDGSLTNIAIWYQANKLPGLYIALSRTCCKALAKLKEQQRFDRELLPSIIELYRLRSEFIANDKNFKEACVLLGKDWRELCH